MSQKRKLLILSLFLCLSISCVFGTESKAEDASGEQATSTSGMKDENTQRLERVTGMDEEGNIYEVDGSGGTVDSSGITPYLRSVPLRVVNFRTKGNATTNYTEVGTGTSGYTNGAYGADAAYLGTSGGKVKFMLAGVVGQVNESEVQVVNFSDAKSVSYYQVANGRLIHYITQDMSKSSSISTLDNGPAPSYLSGGTTYYSYDGHYFYTNYGTMLADYQNNSRSQSVNAGSPYYNYFQYLPMRSKTGYSGSELNTIVNNRTSAGSKMRDAGGQFVSNQDIYGVNALLMAGIAANESAWGNSNICQTKNNLFGLNAVDSSPEASADVYASVNECIRQFSNGWMSRQYLNPSNWKYKGAFLGNKASGINVSYASDPYWGEKAAAIAWKLDGDGGGRDIGAYTIAIKDTISTSHVSVNVRSNSNTGSPVVYKTGGHSSYSVLVLDTNPVNNFYKIQSDAVLNSGKTGIASGVGEYDFDNMYAYISADYVTIVNQGNSMPVKKELQSVSIAVPPAKTAYTEGESFDPAGMKVMAQWSDGSETDITQEASYPAEPLALGTVGITVSYTFEGVTKTAEQPIQVAEKAVVSGVEINPAAVELKAGESYTFGVLVTGTGNFSKSVTWSVEGALSAATKIDGNGKLEIAEDEAAQSLTVKAVSVADPAKWAQAAVTVAKEAVVPEPENPDDSETPEPENPDTEIPDDENPDVENPDVENPDAVIPDNIEAKDETTGIKVKGTMPEGIKLEVQTIDPDNEQYAPLVSDERVKNNTILGVFDIKLDKEFDINVPLNLSFPVDEAYNGQEVIILHYYEEDGKTFTQSFTAEVKDGAAEIQVTGFSPYVLALNDSTPPSDGPTDKSDDTTPPSDEPTDTTPPSDEPTDTTPPADEPTDTTPPADEPTDTVPPSDEPSDGLVDTIPPSDTTPPSDEPTDVVPPINGAVTSPEAGGVTGPEEPAETVKKEEPKKSAEAPAGAGTTTAKEQKKAPKTGDTSSAVIWVLLLAASAVTALIAGYGRIRKIHK